MQYLGWTLIAASVGFCLYTFGLENRYKAEHPYSEKPPLTVEEVIRVVAMIGVGTIGGVILIIYYIF